MKKIFILSVFDQLSKIYRIRQSAALFSIFMMLYEWNFVYHSLLVVNVNMITKFLSENYHIIFYSLFFPILPSIDNIIYI
jgi:hypothetical protein